MDKLKQVFSPGSKKDDEVLYGDADTRRASAAGNTSQQPPEQLHAVEGSNKKEHGILSQIINPGGDKYDEQRFGTTATTQEPVREPNKLYTDPATSKDHTIARQILNPNNDKYDEQRFGETAATGGDRRTSVPATQVPPVAGAGVQLQTDPGKKDHSVLRQVLNPHGDKYDEQGYGSTAHAAGDKDPQALRSDPVSNPDSSITRQILNPGQEKYDPVVHGSSQPSAGAAATSTTTTTTTAAATAASSQGVGYTAAEDKITERPHPLSERAGDVAAPSATAQGAYAGTTSTTSGPHPVGPAGGAHINPVGAPVESLTSGGSSHLERDAAVVGAGTAGATAAVAASTQINSAPSDVQNATYTERAYPVGGGYHHTAGPHQTDIANVLDPHVPGEFPTEQGTDKHGLNNPPLGPVVATDEPSATTTSTTSTNNTSSSENKTIVGTIASAVGLGGLVGGLAGKEQSDQPVEPTQSTSATTHPGGDNYPIQTTTNTLPSAPAAAQGTGGISAGETGDKSDEHHYGRDAGVAAGVVGAGAAGYGGYQATKDGQEDTGPASKTIVPHESNVANIVDPRVQPDLEKQKQSTTVGPHSSDLANKADPRVQSDPAKVVEEEKNLSRDAAVAGGAGVAGVGAIVATRHEDTSAGQTSSTSNTGTGEPPSVADQKAREGEIQRAAAQAQQPPQEGGHTVYILDKPTSLKPNPPENDVTKEDPSTSKKLQKSSRDEESSEKSGEEKKHGLLHKILHPGSSRKDKKDDEDKEQGRQSTEQPQRQLHQAPPGTLDHPLVTSEDVGTSTEQTPQRSLPQAPPPGSLNHPLVTSEDIDNRISTDEKGHNKLHKKSVEQ